MGVAVSRYIDILILFSRPLVLAHFLAAASLLLCSFFKRFFSCIIIISSFFEEVCDVVAYEYSK